MLHGLKSLQESRSVVVVGVDLETRDSRSSPQFSVVVTLQEEHESNSKRCNLRPPSIYGSLHYPKKPGDLGSQIERG